jgi:rubrerythrin
MSNSHEGCSGSFENGKQVVDKVRMMGYAVQNMPNSLQIICEECGIEFSMNKYEDVCPTCGMVFGVTPCHAYDAQFVKPAGINY